MKKTFFFFCLWLTGCASHGPLSPVPPIDLPQFMGKWYVIAHIPTFVETEAFNAIEVYELNDDGTIDIQFSFNDQSQTGPFKSYNFKAFVDNKQNSQWNVQPIWPIKADYKITYLDASFKHTVIARQKRDYVWIMARTPQVSEVDYLGMVKHIESIGYDVNKLRTIPHEIDE